MKLMYLFASLALLSVSAAAQHDSTAAGENPMDSHIAAARVEQAMNTDLDIDERIELLSQIIERSDDIQLVSLAHYNYGTLILKNLDTHFEQFPEAIEAYRLADKAALIQNLRTHARFNLGQLYYHVAHHEDPESTALNPGDLDSMLTTLNAKVDQLLQAAGAFRSVSELDRSHTDSQSNLERVRIEIQQLRDQIQSLEDLIEQQKEQQSQQQQQQQDMADKLDDLAQEQQDQADQSSDSPPQTKGEQEVQQNKQEELNSETGEAQKEVSEQKTEDSQSEQLEEVEKKLQEAQDSQQRAQEAMKNGDQEAAAQEQQNAADALKDAAEQMQDIADQSKQESEEQGTNEGISEEGKPSENEEDAQPEESDEISEIAKELLEKERRERESRQVYRSTGKPTKVEKDW